MISVLIDTNVILDAVAHRIPFYENAEKIIMLTAERKIKGYITANSVTDIYYIAKKQLSNELTREALRDLFKIFSVIDVTGGDCEEALDIPLQDYEDAVVVICGGKMRVDYIVTRDDVFLQSENIEDVEVINPIAFLEMVENE